MMTIKKVLITHTKSSHTEWLNETDEVTVTATPAATRIATISYTVDGGTPTTMSSGDVLTLNHFAVYDLIIAFAAASTVCEVTAVSVPSGATISSTDITASVGNSVSSQTIDVSVSSGATWKLYSDNLYANEISNKTVTLSVGDNVFYIKVTAQDGSATKQYTLTITRAASSGGGGGGGGSSNNTPQPPPSDNPDGGTTTDTPKGTVVGVETTTTQNADTGAVSAVLTADNVSKAFETAADTVVGITISIPESPTITNKTPVDATVAKDAFNTIASNNAALTIEAPSLSITFDSDAVGTIAGAGSGDVVISAGLADTSTLTSEQSEAVGDRPVYSFTVTNDGAPVSNLGGSATISLPYELKPGEDPNAIIICYIDAQGNVQTVPGGVYNAETGKITFAVAHFSLYMINHRPISFTDTLGHWAASSITFVASRDLFSGVGDGLFDPNGSMTRAMFATVLANLEGVNLPAQTSSRFVDVPNGAWYAGAVEWAASNGIVSGVGGDKFDPNASITREQMAVMLGRYIGFKGISLPSAASGINFDDNAQISAWAADSVNAIQEAGIITGKAGNLFDPGGIATRAEVSTVFARFIGSLSV